MPRPGMQIPQWKSLGHLCEGSVGDALNHIMALHCKLVIITTGSEWPSALCQLDVPYIDVRSFFSTERRQDIHCPQQTSFSHDDMYLSSLTCIDCLWHARDAALQLLEFNAAAINTTNCVTISCVISCNHGLHRSQAVARSVGEYVASRGCSVCVLNSSVFTRRWCAVEHRAAVMYPIEEPTPQRDALHLSTQVDYSIPIQWKEDRSPDNTATAKRFSYDPRETCRKTLLQRLAGDDA